METAAKRRLGDIFIERRLLTTEQLERALTEQRTSGGKLGEILVELGMVTRVALAGVISEQWNDLGLTASVRKHAETTEARQAAAAAAAATATAASTSSPAVEAALRERLEVLTAELAVRDARIAQLDATIAALLARGV